MKNTIRPDNAMLVIAGRFDEEKTTEYVTRHFGSIPAPTRELPTTYTIEPAQDGERQVTLRRVGDVGLVAAAYHIPAGSHEDFATVRVLSSILAMEPAGRLYKGMVESKKAASISGFAFPFHDPGLLMAMAEVRDQHDLQDAHDALVTQIEGVGATEITEEEVERARRQMLKSWENSLADSSQLGRCLE